jgi:cation transport ATPase
MFLLVVVLSVHVSFGTTTKRNMDRQYNDQKKHGQTMQRPKETWTDNKTTKRNMDRQYKDQKKHEQAIQRPKETFGSCIACPCFFWSLYCLSMFLLVVVLPVHVSFMFLLVFALSVYVGQTIQRPKETWTGNTTTKRNMDRQYNDQKKHGQTIQRPKETWTDNTTTKRNIFGRCIVCAFFFWSLYCLSMFLLEVLLPVHVSFGRCIVCPCFFWSLYCLSMFLLVVVLPVHVSFGI